MGIGVAVFVVAVVIIAIWVIVEFKRLRHKMFAIFLIVLILFSYLSFSYVLKGKDINLKSVSGIIEGGKFYFLWLGSMFGNAKSITSYVVKMNWRSNETSTNE